MKTRSSFLDSLVSQVASYRPYLQSFRGRSLTKQAQGSSTVSPMSPTRIWRPSSTMIFFLSSLRQKRIAFFLFFTSSWVEDFLTFMSLKTLMTSSFTVTPDAYRTHAFFNTQKKSPLSENSKICNLYSKVLQQSQQK